MTFNEPEERLHAPQPEFPHQLPDYVGHDGEDREVALEPLPPPERGVPGPRRLCGAPRSPARQASSPLSERSVV